MIAEPPARRGGRPPPWLRRLALASAALLLAGCASTRLASTWRDTAFTRLPLKKVAVVVVSQDQNIRRFAEDQAVRSVPRGTAAVASYTLFEQPDADIATVKARLVRDGFDGALVARLVTVDRGKTYVPPQTHIVPLAAPPLAPYRSFYGFYPYAWAYTYTTPGYTADFTRVIIETLVYELPEGRAVWSGVSETVNPDSTLDLVTQLVQVVRAELLREGLLAGEAPR